MTTLIKFISAKFLITPWVTIPMIVLFCTAVLAIVFMSVILLLDSFYRPNVPQYPFNIFLDRIIPIFILILPLILIIGFRPFEYWFIRLVLLILVHCFIIIPVLHYWSNLRRWFDVENKQQYSSWNHPRLYKNIAIAILYPLIWGVYFSLTRFIRIGSTWDVYGYITTLDKDYVLLVFIFPHLFLWLIIFLTYLSKLRRFLWNELYVILYSIHVVFLRYYYYFRLMELVFKFKFIIHCVFAIRLDFTKEYKEYSLWRRIIEYLYFYPRILIIVMIFSVILEVILTGKLFWGVYTLFIFPFIYSLLSCFFSFGNTDFIFDCCLSDYLSRHWTNPRYPDQFWVYFRDAEYYYGFEQDFIQHEVDVITEELEKYTSSCPFRKKVSLSVHQDEFFERICKRSSCSFMIRVAIWYLVTYKVNWTYKVKKI